MAVLLTAGLMAVAGRAAISGETLPVAKAIIQLAPYPSKDTLEKIDETGRRMLALRSYLRAGSSLADRWSWTKEQITAFEGTPEQKALLAAVEAVGAHFAAANPGFGLYVNIKVRSLDDQIAAWNNNDSVGDAARELDNALVNRFGKEGVAPFTIDIEDFAEWLRRYQLRQRANLAAPGLSAHGRAQAIDFQIARDGRVIASADSRQIETVWKKDGWTEKLKASMDAAGPAFHGPLTNPDEPWHYDYRSDAKGPPKVIDTPAVD